MGEAEEAPRGPVQNWGFWFNKYRSEFRTGRLMAAIALAVGLFAGHWLGGQKHFSWSATLLFLLFFGPLISVVIAYVRQDIRREEKMPPPVTHSRD